MRILVDDITAANDLGLIDAVPVRIEVLTDRRLRPITLGNLTLDRHYAGPSRLYWAGRPAMRFVEALHWLRDMLPSDDGGLRGRLISILRNPDRGQAIREDLRAGFSALPEWMRAIVRDLLRESEITELSAKENAIGSAMTAGFQTVLAASERERRDLFLAAANRLGTAEQNIEKDFWECWTRDALFNGLEPGGPHLLFKGGTSLSKS